MGISHLANKRPKNIKQSSILMILMYTEFNDYIILSKSSINFNLLIKEWLLIACDKPILNKTVKSFPFVCNSFNVTVWM